MSAADSLDAWGVLRAAAVVDIAAAAGLELAAAATLLEKESGGGRNVWGHDGVATGGHYRKGGPVTRENYTAWRPHRSRLGSQGVGPCQLTWPGYQDRADALGGCWNPTANMRVGFGVLAQLQDAYGERDGFRRYNGSGPAAQRYAEHAMGRLARWRDRLGSENRAPSSGGLLRRGARGPAVAEVQRVLNAWYPRDPRLEVDGVFGPATEAAVRRAQVRAGLAADGVVGPRTRAALHLS